MKIEIEIFSDDNPLVTCARWFGSEDRPPEMCGFLLTKRFGTEYCCGLFRQNGKEADLHTQNSDGTGYIIPCKECIDARYSATLQKGS